MKWKLSKLSFEREFSLWIQDENLCQEPTLVIHIYTSVRSQRLNVHKWSSLHRHKMPISFQFSNKSISPLTQQMLVHVWRAPSSHTKVSLSTNIRNYSHLFTGVSLMLRGEWKLKNVHEMVNGKTRSEHYLMEIIPWIS